MYSYHFGFLSEPTNPSSFKQSGYPFFFFDGCAKDPNVQAVIKANYISLMTSALVVPFFCPMPQCTADNIEVFAGISGTTKGKTMR